MMAIDPKRRRALLRTWLPTGIIVVVIAAVVVTMASLLAGGLGAPPPAPTAGQVTEINRSVFTDDGLDYIASTRVVRIDLSEPPTAAAPLGLPEAGEIVLPIIATGDTELDYALRVYGGGADPGGLRCGPVPYRPAVFPGPASSVHRYLGCRPWPWRPPPRLGQAGGVAPRRRPLRPPAAFRRGLLRSPWD